MNEQLSEPLEESPRPYISPEQKDFRPYEELSTEEQMTVLCDPSTIKVKLPQTYPLQWIYEGGARWAIANINLKVWPKELPRTND